MGRIVKEAEVRRQEILDTAVGLFCEKGYEKTSMAEIAQSMKVAQGLCYRYFPSKEALFEAAIDRYAGVLAGRVEALLQANGLRELLDRLPLSIEDEAEDGDSYRLTHGERSTHDLLFCRVCAKLVPVVAAVLRRAAETGEASVPDPDTAAAFCVYGQMGVLTREDLTLQEKRERTRAFLPRVCGLE